MEKEIVVNGKKIVYFEEGEGFPFLIIHGWAPRAVFRFSSFQKVLARHGYRVIALSLPGFGENGFSLRGWSMEEYLKCILSFIDQMNLEKIFLIGYSMGGAMAIRFAATYPERVKVLVLLSPGVIPSPTFNIWGWHLFIIFIYGWMMVVKIWEFLLVLFTTILNFLIFFIKLIRLEKVVNWSKDFLKRIVRKTAERLDLARIRYRLIKLLEPIARSANTLPYLPEIKCSVLTIWGERDFNFNLPIIGGARFMGRIPNYTFKIIPAVGHQFPESAPGKTAELVIDFIKKLENKEGV